MAEPYDWSEPAHLRVVGIPQPQGSKTCICVNNRGRIIEGRRGPARKMFHEWRGAVTAGAILWQTSHNATPLDAPCRLRLVFSLPRPKSVRRGQPDGRPDLDKLVRAVCDSLTKVLYFDDSRVCEIITRKQYATDGRNATNDRPAGVSITLERL